MRSITVTAAKAQINDNQVRLSFGHGAECFGHIGRFSAHFKVRFESEPREPVPRGRQGGHRR